MSLDRRRTVFADKSIPQAAPGGVEAKHDEMKGLQVYSNFQVEKRVSLKFLMIRVVLSHRHKKDGSYRESRKPLWRLCAPHKIASARRILKDSVVADK